MADSEHFSPLLCFWLPQFRPSVPTSSSAAIAPLTLRWNSFGYPGLHAALSSADPPQAINLRLALEALVTTRCHHTLYARNLFLILTVIFFVYGVVQAGFVNQFAVVPLAMSCFWAMLTRFMANRLVKELASVEREVRGKMEEIGKMFLGPEWTLAVGASMQWVSVINLDYHPPDASSARLMP